MSFYMHKQPGKKDAIRVWGWEDIPEFLAGTVGISNDAIEINSVEGTEYVDLGSVIAYEQSDTTATGWNAWWKANADETLQEIGGEFYEIPTIVTATEMTEEFPYDLINEGDAAIEFDGFQWNLDAGWGMLSGRPGECVWVLYGWHDDGTADMNILTLSEESARQYTVCDEDGNDLRPLVY